MKQTLRDQIESLLGRLKANKKSMIRQLQDAYSNERFMECHNLRLRIDESDSIINDIENILY